MSDGSAGEKEIAELAAAFSRNPRSVAFVPLAMAYLSAGRARDAMGVLTQGLTVHPRNVEARILLARAQVAIKQWGEAQAQLLQVVEVDPVNVDAFVLLSEVCSHAEDFERARLALEQASDLRPDDPDIRARLAAARRGEMPPTGEALGRITLSQAAIRPAEERVSARARPPSPPPSPPPAAPRASRQIAVEKPFAPLESGKIQRPATPAAPAERPRVSATPHKEKDKGAGDMRRSAAIERDYLGDLIAGGLLDVPNVTARPQKDPRRARRIWRRVLGGLALVALAGLVWAGIRFGPALLRGGPRPVPEEARLALLSGQSADHEKAMAACTAALDKHADAEGPLGARAALSAFALWELGEGSLADVDAAIARAAQKLDPAPPGTPGQRELALARAVRALATRDEKSLGEARLAVDHAVGLPPADGLARLVDGYIKVGQGDAAAARVAWEEAAQAGAPAANVALGDLALDGSDLATAKDHYAKALQVSKKQPFALVGRALVVTESSSDPTAAIEDLGVGIADARGVRLGAWKALGQAAVQLVLDDAEKAGKELEVASKTPLVEPRFLLRLALFRVARGEIAEATRLRAQISETAIEASPLAPLVDAELALAKGRADLALSLAEGRADRRGRIVRGRALIDLGRAKDAISALEPAVAAFPDDVVLATWLDLARALAEPEGKAIASLEKRARALVSTFPRGVLGWAEWSRGNVGEAKRDLEAALEGNPLAYRAHALLGEIALGEHEGGGPAARLDEAEKSVRAALELAPDYLPAKALLGRILVLRDKPGDAVAALAPVAEAKLASGADELALAEALARTGEKAKARAALARAVDKHAPAADAARVADLVSPNLAKELGLRD
jgi:tetratricopeptide (TPR) repeat protein